MWMFPNFNPVAFAIGPIAVHWYGLAYLFSFLALRWWGMRACRRGVLDLLPEQFDQLVFWIMLGVILGGRLGYMLAYTDRSWIVNAPWQLLAVWHGGMSFHGGVLGVVAAIVLFCRRHRCHWLMITDWLVCYLPIGLGLGRLANFINGELWGRVTNVPWAVIYSHVDRLPRHPSPLYEFLGEGIVLFAIMQMLRRFSMKEGSLSACFLMGYGIIRFGLEYFRAPDPQLGFVVGSLSMGQCLSLVMMIAGIAWIIRLRAGSTR